MRYWGYLALSGLLLASAASAAGLPAAGDPVAGRDKAMPCTGCHGPQGVSSNPQFPNLAGQKRGYLNKQLTEFKSGLRANSDTMSGYAKSLSAADAHNLAAYFSCLSPVDGHEPAGGLKSCK